MLTFISIQLIFWNMLAGGPYPGTWWFGTIKTYKLKKEIWLSSRLHSSSCITTTEVYPNATLVPGFVICNAVNDFKLSGDVFFLFYMTID